MDVKLDKQFQMVQHNPSYAYEALPVELESPEKQTFSSKFCLRYDTNKAADIAKLEKLAFKSVELDGKTVYTRCVSAKGNYYATPNTVAEDYRFEKSVPVRIYYKEAKTKTDGWKLTNNILQTPFTLALDAVGAVLVLPLTALGKAADTVRK